MAEPGDLETGEDTKQQQQPNEKNVARKDIEKVTDFTEEIEVDSSKLEKAMSLITTLGGAPTDAARNGGNSAAQKQEIELLMREFCVGHARAEKALQSSDSLQAAIQWLINDPFYQ